MKELKILVNALRPRCDLCGRRVTYETLGYIRIRRGVIELTLCKDCLRDYAEYVVEKIGLL